VMQNVNTGKHLSYLELFLRATEGEEENEEEAAEAEEEEEGSNSLFDKHTDCYNILIVGLTRRTVDVG